ncbi:MAG: ComF family protein [Bradymonadales bacterium]|nr:MAG: ComF family protein [Bradymonadales bacterium]
MWTALKDFVLPLCGNCESASASYFCQPCRDRLAFKNVCPLCGQEGLAHCQSTCLSCQNETTPWDKLKISFVYRDGVIQWIRKIKDQSRPELWRVVSKEDVMEFQDRIDAVLPLPSDPLKRRKRGYGSSELLARRIAKLLNSDFIELFDRKPSFKSQRDRSLYERYAELRSEISLKPHQKIPPGKLLLVDDVMTTGASLWICAEILQAKAVELEAFVVARVPKAKPCHFS